MKTLSPQVNPRKENAAENAQTGLIGVDDLSVLVGVAAAQLTKFAKIGQLEHFGEYHGRRFYNFQTIVQWAMDSEVDTESKTVIHQAMKVELSRDDCPYTLAKGTFQLLWKKAATV